MAVQRVRGDFYIDIGDSYLSHGDFAELRTRPPPPRARLDYIDTAREVIPMATPKRPTEVETVQCDVCMAEIPLSEAKSAEAEEYVMHFCGLDCYDKWRRQGGEDKDEKKS
jgi:hypothetical protein